MKLVSAEDIILACMKIWEMCGANELNPLDFKVFLKKTNGKLEHVKSERTPYVTWVNDSEYVLYVDQDYLERTLNPNQNLYRGLISVIQKYLLELNFLWVYESKVFYQELLATFIMCPKPILVRLIQDVDCSDESLMFDAIKSQTSLKEKEIFSLLSAYGFCSEKKEISFNKDERNELYELKNAILDKVGIKNPSIEEIVASFQGKIETKAMFELFDFKKREDNSFILSVRCSLNKKIPVLDALFGFGCYFFEENGLQSSTKRVALAELLLDEVRKD